MILNEVKQSGSKKRVPSEEEILETCREVRKEIYKREVEPWMKTVLKSKE